MTKKEKKRREEETQVYNLFWLQGITAATAAKQMKISYSRFTWHMRNIINNSSYDTERIQEKTKTAILFAQKGARTREPLPPNPNYKLTA